MLSVISPNDLTTVVQRILKESTRVYLPQMVVKISQSKGAIFKLIVLLSNHPKPEDIQFTTEKNPIWEAKTGKYRFLLENVLY